MSLHLLSLKNLPHTYSCTCFYSKENKDGNKQGPYWFQITWDSRIFFIDKYSKSIYFFYFIYTFIILLLTCFFHGKGVTGNLAGWKHDMRMHELWDYLPDRTH